MSTILYVETAKRVEYDPETGIMIWKYDSCMPKRWNTRFAGKQAGCKLSNNGGRVISITRDKISHLLLTRRLAYLITYGELPDFVGVADGDPFNDAASNLIRLTALELGRKGKRNSINTSGITGVSFSKFANKWVAGVSVNGSCRGNVKYFKDKNSAETWVKQRRAELGFNPELHGRG